MTWPNYLAGQELYVAGVLKSPRRNKWNLASGFSVAWNASTNMWDITATGGGGGGSGDVVGPASSVDQRVVVFSGTTGKLIAQSSFLIADLIKRNGGTVFTADQSLGNNSLTAVKSLSLNSEIDNATNTIDWTAGAAQKKTANADATIVFTAPAAFTGVQLRVIGDGTARTWTWPAGVTWLSGSPPTLASGLDVSTLLGFWHLGGGNYLGAVAGGGGGGGTVTAGDGLTDTAGTFSVDAADATLVVGASGVKRAPITGDVGIPDGSNTATIAAGAVDTAELADDAVTFAKLLNATAAGKIVGSDAAGNFKEMGVAGGIERSGTDFIVSSQLPARGTENIIVDLYPSTQQQGTVANAASVNLDVAIAAGKRYTITASVWVDDGAGGACLYSKDLLVKAHQTGGAAVEIDEVTLSAPLEAAGFTFVGAPNGTNYRFTLSNTSGSPRSYNVAIGFWAMDKP